MTAGFRRFQIETADAGACALTYGHDDRGRNHGHIMSALGHRAEMHDGQAVTATAATAVVGGLGMLFVSPRLGIVVLSIVVVVSILSGVVATYIARTQIKREIERQFREHLAEMHNEHREIVDKVASGKLG